jgi:hypothetical protein
MTSLPPAARETQRPVTATPGQAAPKPEANWTCEFCPAKFADLAHAEQHVRVEHPNAAVEDENVFELAAILAGNPHATNPDLARIILADPRFARRHEVQPAPVSPDLECTACAPGATPPHGVTATPGQAAEVAEAPFRVWMHEVGHDPDDMRTYYGVGALAEAFQGGTQLAAAAQEPHAAPGKPHRHPFAARDCECPPDCECWQPAVTPQPAPELAAAMRETRFLRAGIAALTARLDASARATSPSKKSDIEAEIAIALRKLLEGK